jgi:hypothetical protein
MVFKTSESEFLSLSLYFAEEECYHCVASLVAAKEKVFITQTKLLFEVTWKTVMQIAKKHAVSKNNMSAVTGNVTFYRKITITFCYNIFLSLHRKKKFD